MQLMITLILNQEIIFLILFLCSQNKVYNQLSFNFKKYQTNFIMDSLWFISQLFVFKLN